MLNGSAIFSWVQRLAPHLDGRRTLDELTDGLPDDQRAMVERVVSALLDTGLATDATRTANATCPAVEAGTAASRGGSLRPWETQRCAAEISYLDRLVNSPTVAPARYRACRHAVVGSGVMFVAVVEAVLRLGVRHVTAIVTGECDTDLAGLTQRAERDGDRSQRLVARAATQATDDLTRELSEVAVLLHASDRPMSARARWLDQWCSHHGVVAMHALAVGDEAWLGPIHGAGARWESAWRRRHRQDPAAELIDQPDAPLSQHLSPTTAVVLANQLAVEALRRVTEAPPTPHSPPAFGSGTLRCVDLATLHSTDHRFLAHPLAQPAEPPGRAGLLTRVTKLSRGDRLDPAGLEQRAAVLLDRRLGVLTELSEPDGAQHPLNVAMVRVAGAAPSEVATGAGLDLRTARLRAVLRGVERYARGVLDPRRTELSSRGPVVWGFDLTRRYARDVLATQAFPTGPSSTVAGVAAGYDWASTMLAALLSHCQVLTIAEASSRSRSRSRTRSRRRREVSLDAMAMDEDATTYRKLLEVAGVPIRVLDLTGSLGIPTFAVQVGARTVAYASDLDPAAAIGRGLENALLDYQARSNSQPRYAPATLTSSAPRIPQQSDVDDVNDLVVALARAGHVPVVVPLDHDPELAAILPYVVSVVLAND